MLHLKQLKLMRKLKILRVGNTLNENITKNNSSIWSLWGKSFIMMS